jgi:hypothetical protein
MTGRTSFTEADLGRLLESLVREPLQEQIAEYLPSDVVGDPAVQAQIAAVAAAALQKGLEPHGLKLIECRLDSFAFQPPAATMAADDGDDSDADAMDQAADLLALLGEEPVSAASSDVGHGSTRFFLRMTAIVVKILGLGLSLLTDVFQEHARTVVMVLIAAAAVWIVVELFLLKLSVIRKLSRRVHSSQRRASLRNICLRADAIMRARLYQVLGQSARYLRQAGEALAGAASDDQALQLRELARKLEIADKRVDALADCQAMLAGSPSLEPSAQRLTGNAKSLILQSTRLLGLSRRVLQEAQAHAVEELEPLTEAMVVVLADIEESLATRELLGRT